MIMKEENERRDVKKEYGKMGLRKSELERNIEYDIGVEEIKREIEESIDEKEVMGGF